MDKQNEMEQWVDRVLQSADGADRARPRPFLFTRLQARMQRPTDSGWEKAMRFISRPAVAIAGLCLILAINLTAVMVGGEGRAATDVATEETAPDDLTGTVATLYDIDNEEP
jgi:hypothetical protein